MGSEGPKPVTINVTGFKKFQGVPENPTETIVNNLKSFVEKKGLPPGVTFGTCTVLEAAGDGALPMLFKVMESGISSGGSTCDAQVVWLHLGVNSGAHKFAIERQAVNEATFRCPDELGWRPQVEMPLFANQCGLVLLQLFVLEMVLLQFPFCFFQQLPIVPEDGKISRTRQVCDKSKLWNGIC
ncbi:hypothetical protein ACJRO7_031398 [Eucalyptus globulus]|uniref:Uncharacterized protein n=1 Tax=Eucalyptus globulus TaxID=34317 RepID=A0ABD3JSK9_EUCGL